MHTVCALQTRTHNQKSLTDKAGWVSDKPLKVRRQGAGNIQLRSLARSRHPDAIPRLHNPPSEKKKKNSWNLKMTGIKWYELIWGIPGWCSKLYHAFLWAYDGPCSVCNYDYDSWWRTIIGVLLLTMGWKIAAFFGGNKHHTSPIIAHP